MGDSKRRGQGQGQGQGGVPSARMPAGGMPLNVVPPPPDDKPQLVPLLNAIEKIRGRPLFVLWNTDLARFSAAAEMPLFDLLRTVGKVDAVDVLLYTSGGDTEAPLLLVNLIREFANKLGVLVPHRAFSAGTLFALGADEIVMTPLSSLGPIDPTRSHPLLPKREGAAEAEPISVQDMRHAMHFIREAAPTGGGMAYTPEAMAHIFTALFDKIHPLAIGALEQSYALAKLIGRNCLATHMDREADTARINEIVDRLCDEYKSHVYRIGRREARSIGLKVTDAPADLEAAMLSVLAFYINRPTGPFGQVQPGQMVRTHIAWLESNRQFFRVEGDMLVGPQQGQFELRGDAWRPY